MKQESILLLSQIENLPNIIKLNERLSITELSNDTHLLLHFLFRKIHEANDSWKNYCDNIVNSYIEVEQKEIIAIAAEEYNYIPSEIRTSIESHCKMAFKVTISLENRTVYLYMCVPGTYSPNQCYNTVFLVYIWFYFVNTFVNDSCSKVINLFLFLTPEKKVVPKFMNTEELLDRNHINTAFTTACKPKTNVFIFREEEWFRALIHESFHNLGLDLLGMPHKQIKEQENRLKSVFNINIEDMRISETYCEIWAETLNVMFYVYETYSDYNCNDKILLKLVEKFTKYIFFEKAFSLWQCSKILYLHKLDYRELFSPNKNVDFNEKTQIFSYYILKCILMVHIDEFLDFCSVQYYLTNYPKKTFDIAFNKTPTTLKTYVDIFINNHNTKNMLFGIDNMTINLKKKKRTTLFKTLKMSLIQINTE
uniref:Uncharacterized protein n=1 Tax=viral metagenome TaxID=1070528 RepID=A0A6C0CPC0_9ZZZZ